MGPKGILLLTAILVSAILYAYFGEKKTALNKESQNSSQSVEK